MFKGLSGLFFIGGFASMAISIAIYVMGQSETDAVAKAARERLAIFIGLWPPTFFILSERFKERDATRSENRPL